MEIIVDVINVKCFNHVQDDSRKLLKPKGYSIKG